MREKKKTVNPVSMGGLQSFKIVASGGMCGEIEVQLIVAATIGGNTYEAHTLYT